MTLEIALTILISSVFVNNCVAYFGFGNVAIGENTKNATFLSLSCLIFCISVIFATFASFFIKDLLFIKYNLMDLMPIVYVIFAVLPIFIIGLIVFKRSNESYFLLKDNTYLITFAAAVVGSVNYILLSTTSLAEMAVYVFGVCVGFSLINSILYSFSGYARRNMEGFTPYLFNVLSLAIISIIIMTFSNVI